MLVGPALTGTQLHHDLYLAVVTDTWPVPGRHQAGDQMRRDIHTVKPGLGHMIAPVEGKLSCSWMEKTEAVMIVEFFLKKFQNFAELSLTISCCVNLCQDNIPVPSHYRKLVPPLQKVD